MNPPAWVAALLLSLGAHAGLAMVVVPLILSQYSDRLGKTFSPQAQSTVLGFALGWCVVAAVWSALVTKALSNDSNRWGGIHGVRLFGIVAGLTIALDLVNAPCLWSCPPLALVVPILSAVAVFNNSHPIVAEAPPSVDETAG